MYLIKAEDKPIFFLWDPHRVGYNNPAIGDKPVTRTQQKSKVFHLAINV